MISRLTRPAVVVVGAFTLAWLGHASAQSDCGGKPYSFLHPVDPGVPTVSLDEPRPAPDAEWSPARYGAWEPARDGARIWRLRCALGSGNAYTLFFSRFALPAGASLFVYDDERSFVRGAYTELHNRLDGTFAFGPLPGGAVTLEYYEPDGVDAPLELAIAGVAEHVPERSDRSAQRRERRSPECHVDVACPEGEGWEVPASSIVTIDALSQFCTGVLVNNTLGDRTPFVLTALHCGKLTRSQVRFNWRREACGEGQSVREGDNVYGADFVVGDRELDVMLVRLREMPPAEYGVQYAGWDRSGREPTETVCLHHPGGDFLKISVDEDPPQKRRAFWRVGRWDTGATFLGSSGAPLFDEQKRVIGVLKGGDSTCEKPSNDMFGRLRKFWPKVSPYLDPAGTDAQVLDGLDPSTGAYEFAVHGVSPQQVSPAGQTVEVTGWAFSHETSVLLDGQPLRTKKVKDVRWIRNSLLEVDVPAVPPGAHVLTIQHGDVSHDLEIVVASPEPAAVDGAEEEGGEG